MTLHTESTSVSAVIAMYNGEKHIVDAIESILGQTQSVSEIVIVNDGSSDNSINVIKDFLEANSSAQRLVRVIDQQNCGQGSARNAGVEAANGDLIGFLDQDDTWEPTHVSIMAPYFKGNPRLGWVYTDFNEIDEHNRFIRRQYLAKQNYSKPINSIFGLIHQDLMMLPSASLIRRNAFMSVGGFDTQFRGYEDDDLFIRIFVQGYSFKYLKDALVNYRIHPDNSSRNLTFPNSRIKFYRKYRFFFDKDSDYFPMYFHQHLAPRMVKAAIQDAIIASRDRNEPSRKLASDFLGELFSDIGFNLRARVVFVCSKSSALLRIALFVRSIFRIPAKKPKTNY